MARLKRRKKALRKPLTRSEQMARIRGANTKPERVLARALWAAGHRYRLRARCCGIRPDMVFTRARVAVFVDGCFWHGCPDHYVRPRTGTSFWSRKLRENVERDRRQSRVLAQAGWRAVRIWEHQLLTDLAAAVAAVRNAIGGYVIDSPQWRVAEAAPLDADERFESRTLVALVGDEPVRSIVYKRHTRKQ